jgi:16S rRNA (guanine966-N2)-methyltransferase
VVAAEAERYLRSGPGRFDLALLDPPYAYDDWDRLLAAVPAEVVVVESDRPVDPGDGWQITRQKRYGTTVVGVLRRLPRQPPPRRGAVA